MGSSRGVVMVGTVAMSARVYACAALPPRRSAELMSSTNLPRYITSTRVHSDVTTAMSCDTNMIAVPSSSLMRRSMVGSPPAP